MRKLVIDFVDDNRTADMLDQDLFRCACPGQFGESFDGTQIRICHDSPVEIASEAPKQYRLYTQFNNN